MIELLAFSTAVPKEKAYIDSVERYYPLDRYYYYTDLKLGLEPKLEEKKVKKLVSEKLNDNKNPQNLKSTKEHSACNILAEKSFKVLFDFNKFNIKPEYLAAIIYTERTLNYDWTDRVFDVVLAKNGKNSSIGFCQIKFKTAYFIERQLNDSKLEYYPGKKYEGTIKVSKNPNELIRKLMSDSLNIFYAAAYLRIIQSKWSSAGFSVDDRPDIIGTLFQTGLFSTDGSLREPNPNPRSNKFGKKALESVNLFIKKLSNNIGG